MADAASAANDPLWAALTDYCIGPADAAVSFAAKLAHANGWTAAFTARAIDEYRRFCLLAVTAPHPVAPSDAVDQVWHLHLTYTADYWDRFCPDVLGRALHHHPSTGGAEALAHHHELYAQTLRSYEAAFGPAPADIWPTARQVLLEDWRARRVHLREALIVPRRRVRQALAGLAGLALLVGGAQFLHFSGGWP